MLKERENRVCAFMYARWFKAYWYMHSLTQIFYAEFVFTCALASAQARARVHVPVPTA